MHPMKRLAALFATLVVAAGSTKAQSEADVHWCLTGNADSKITQQPMRDYCPWVLAGSAVGVWYAPQYAGLVMTKTQNGWSNDAAKIACSPDPTSTAAAVGLIAACQCHNKGAADWVVNNPGRVLGVLRKHANCPIR